MRYFTRIVKANGGAVFEVCLGKVLTVQSCTLPISLQLDGSAPRDVRAGSVVEADSEFQAINFVNNNVLDVQVQFAVGYVKADFAPVDNSQSANPTYILSGGGFFTIPVVPAAKKAGGSNWSSNSGVPMDITATFGGVGDAVKPFFIPGTNFGHRRKSIVFQNTTFNNSADAGLFDSQGYFLLRILANNTPLIFEDTADVYIAGIGGAVAQGAFIYHERYYSTAV